MQADNTALLKAEANPDIGVFVDAPHAGAPLIIAFGFVDWRAPGRFDFARRLRKLAQANSQPLNLVLVRDTANFWYQHGVTGLGPDVPATAAALQRIVASLKPVSVGTIGQSMGGYAAILFGTLLEANRMLAFGPLSYLRSDWARRDGDRRWLAVMEALDRFPPPHRCDDLPALLGAAKQAPPVHLVYGTGPDADGPANRDDLHARRYAEHPAVGVETIPEAGHAVVEWLIARDRIDDLIRRQLLRPLTEPGIRWTEPTILPSPDQPPLKPWDDGWRSWIAENLALAATEDSLLATLVESGFHAGEARREIYKAARSPYLLPLARLLERTRG